MGADNEFSDELKEIFFDYASKKSDEARDKDTRFVHYTSARVALSILEKSEVWLRNARVMNDFNEIRHGEQCLLSAWNSDNLGERLIGALNNVHIGVGDKLVTDLQNLNHFLVHQTFLLSLSEHGGTSIDEDKYGRLSMWRAYGGTVNVAIVMKNTPLLGESDALNAFTSPVLYADLEIFKNYFRQVVENVENSKESLSNAGAEAVYGSAITALLFAIMGTKHPGFAEEKEWRILHNPCLWPSSTLIEDFQIIEDVPQKIFRIPLQNYPQKGLFGAEIPELLDRIIIGPTQHPDAIYEAFLKKLESLQVPYAADKIFVSDIPLRR